MRIVRSFAWSLGLLVCSPMAVSAVIVVAPQGGDHSQIQSAVDAAQDGDTVLVKGGFYFSFAIDGKSLTLVAERGEQVTTGSGFPGVFTANAVKNLHATQSVTIRGIDGAYRITDCQGFVRIEDCVVQGQAGFCDPTFGTGQDAFGALVVANSTAVSCVHCEIHAEPGGTGIGPFFNCCTAGKPGIEASGSQVAVYQGELFAAQVPGWPCASAGAVSGSTVTIYDTAVIGPRDVSIASPLRRGEPGVLHLEGTPGDFVFLFTSATPAFQKVPPYPGVLLGLPFAGIFPIGILSTGTLDIPVAFPDIPSPGVPAFDLQIQGAFLGLQGPPVIAPMTILTLLDPAIP